MEAMATGTGWRPVVQGADAAAVALCLPLAQHLGGGAAGTPEALALVGAAAAGAATLLGAFGAYERRGVAVLAPLAIGWIAVVALVVAMAALIDAGAALPPVVAVLWAATSGLVLLAPRALRAAGTALLALRGERTLLVGRSDACRAFALRAEGEGGPLRVVGILVDDAAEPRFAGLHERIDALAVERVVICAPVAEGPLVERLFALLHVAPVFVQFAPDCSRLTRLGAGMDCVGGAPLLDLTALPLRGWKRALKRAEDVALGSVILVAISPVLLAVAALVRLTSPGPALFIQPRHGLHGRPIRVFKFRTMRHPGAVGEAPLAVLLAWCARLRPAVAAPAGGVALRVAAGGGAAGDARPDDFVQATADDPRITPIGRFLRRTSLDELPQFLNVLRGEMSIVGPRPHPLRLNQQHADDVPDLMRRHLAKPGITGLAQVSGSRGETRTRDDMRRRVDLDLDYLRRWSLWLDLRIVVKTVFKGFVNDQP